jgi:hypothetical protein
MFSRRASRGRNLLKAMSGAVWRPVWRSGATSLEGDHGEKRQFKLIHPGFGLAGSGAGVHGRA